MILTVFPIFPLLLFFLLFSSFGFCLIVTRFKFKSLSHFKSLQRTTSYLSSHHPYTMSPTLPYLHFTHQHFTYVQFPRIRKYTAEALYLQLLSDSHALGSTYAETQSAVQSRNLTDPGSTDGTDGDVVPLYTGFAATSEELDAISELIAGTAWDGEISIGRENRQRVCDMMGVKMNVKSSSDQGNQNMYLNFVRYTHSCLCDLQ